MLCTAGVAAGGALVTFLFTHPGPPPGPSPEKAWNILAASCTSPAAYPYRGVVPSVRQDKPGRYLVTAEPPAPAPMLTVRYDRHSSFGSAVDVLRSASRADNTLLAELGCAPRLVWSSLPPG